MTAQPADAAGIYIDPERFPESVLHDEAAGGSLTGAAPDPRLRTSVPLVDRELRDRERAAAATTSARRERITERVAAELRRALADEGL